MFSPGIRSFASTTANNINNSSNSTENAQLVLYKKLQYETQKLIGDIENLDVENVKRRVDFLSEIDSEARRINFTVLHRGCEVTALDCAMYKLHHNQDNLAAQEIFHILVKGKYRATRDNLTAPVDHPVGFKNNELDFIYHVVCQGRLLALIEMKDKDELEFVRSLLPWLNFKTEFQIQRDGVIWMATAFAYANYLYSEDRDNKNLLDIIDFLIQNNALISKNLNDKIIISSDVYKIFLKYEYDFLNQISDNNIIIIVNPEKNNLKKFVNGRMYKQHDNKEFPKMPINPMIKVAKFNHPAIKAATFRSDPKKIIFWCRHIVAARISHFLEEAKKMCESFSMDIEEPGPPPIPFYSFRHPLLLKSEELEEHINKDIKKIIKNQGFIFNNGILNADKNEFVDHLIHDKITEVILSQGTQSLQYTIDEASNAVPKFIEQLKAIALTLDEDECQPMAILTSLHVMYLQIERRGSNIIKLTFQDPNFQYDLQENIFDSISILLPIDLLEDKTNIEEIYQYLCAPYYYGDEKDFSPLGVIARFGPIHSAYPASINWPNVTYDELKKIYLNYCEFSHFSVSLNEIFNALKLYFPSKIEEFFLTKVGYRGLLFDCDLFPKSFIRAKKEEKFSELAIMGCFWYSVNPEKIASYVDEVSNFGFDEATLLQLLGCFDTAKGNPILFQWIDDPRCKILWKHETIQAYICAILKSSLPEKLQIQLISARGYSRDLNNTSSAASLALNLLYQDEFIMMMQSIFSATQDVVKDKKIIDSFQFDITTWEGIKCHDRPLHFLDTPDCKETYFLNGRKYNLWQYIYRLLKIRT